MRRSPPRKTERRWSTTVGLVGPNDVKALQDRVAAYQVQLQITVEALGKAGRPLQAGTAYSDATWNDLVKRCLGFEGETSDTRNPFAYLFSGSSYERGRQLIAELDTWRDELARRAASTQIPVPSPVPVPGSDIGFGGGLGFALAALVAVLALRELR